jgi:hypothetical protein
MIRFWCECGRQLQARAEDIGRLAACPACGKTTPTPDRSQPRPQDAPRSEHGRSRSTMSGLGPEEIGHNNRRLICSAPAAQATDVPPIAKLVMGVLFPTLPEIILVLRETGLSRWLIASRGRVVAGLVIGCIGLLAVSALWLAAQIDYRTDANNLKQITIAFHEHNDTYGYCPAATAYRTKDGKPGLSWRVAILPFIDSEDDLFSQFHFDEPWDSPHNIKLLPRMPKVYLMPGGKSDAGLTHYQVLVGPRTPFSRELPQRRKPDFGAIPLPEIGPRIPADFPNGTSMILVATARDPVPWTTPDDLAYDPSKPLPPLGGHFRGGWYNIGLADGSTRWVDNQTPEAKLRRAIENNDCAPEGGW